MEDLDLKELIRNVIVWLVILVIFGSLLLIILINKFGGNDISINKKIDQKKSLVVLVINSKTKNKKQIENTLKDRNVKYEIIDSEKERYYKTFLQKVSLTENDIIEPTVIIIKKGKVKSTLVDIKKIEELNSFLDFNQ